MPTPFNFKSTFRGQMASLVEAAVRMPAMQHVVGVLPLPARFKQRVPPVGPSRVKAPNGEHFIYVADRRDMMARKIVWDALRTWERSTVDFISTRCRTSAVLWDLGAYTGIYSLLGCAVNPNLRVVAFEPVPDHVGWLRKNLEANCYSERVQVVEAAVSPIGNNVEIVLVNDDITASGIDVERPGRRLTVGTVRLDAFVPLPDIIKIDVEGHEVDALSTASMDCWEHGPDVVAECLNDEALRRFRKFIEPLGYVIYHLGPNGPVPLDDGFKVPTLWANFLATKRN